MTPSLRVPCPEDSGTVMEQVSLCCFLEDWPFNERGGCEGAVTAQVWACVCDFLRAQGCLPWIRVSPSVVPAWNTTIKQPALCLVFPCEFSWAHNNCWSDESYSFTSGKVDACTALPRGLSWPPRPSVGRVSAGPAHRLRPEGLRLQGKLFWFSVSFQLVVSRWFQDVQVSRVS